MVSKTNLRSLCGNQNHHQHIPTAGVRVWLLFTCVFASLILAIPAYGFQSSTKETQDSADSGSDVLTPMGALTPGDAGLEFFIGMMTGDAQRVQNVCVNTESIWNVTEATIDFANNATRFRRRFIEKYGRSAWDTFNDENHVPRRIKGNTANGNITVLEIEEFARIYRELTANQTNEDSRCRFPNTEANLVVLQRDGRWFVDLEESTPIAGEASTELILSLFGSLSDAVEHLTPAIGMEGVTPDQIDYEMGRITLAAMNQPAMPAQPDFSLENLPKLTKGPTEKGKATEKFVRDFLATLISGGEDVGFQQLHSEVQNFTDPAVFAKQVQTLRSCLKGLEPGQVEIEMVEPTTNQHSWQVIAKFEYHEQTGLMNLYLFEDKLVGLEVLFGDYALDTRFASRNTEQITETSKSLLTAVYEHDTDKVVSFYPDEADFKETFESGFADVLRTKFDKIQVLPPSIKVQWPPNEDGLILTCRQLVQYEHANRIVRMPCDTNWQIAKGSQTLLPTFGLGDNDDDYYSNETENFVASIKAFCSGDSDNIIARLDPRYSIEKPVMQAYAESCAQNFGKFESLDRTRFNSRVEYANRTETITSRGNVQLANREMFIEIVHVDGWLDGFTFYEANDDGWQKNIADLKPFVERGKQACQEYFDGNLLKFARLCHEDLEQELIEDILAWKERLEAIHDDCGGLQGVVPGETEYLPEKEAWRCHYRINFGKGYFKAYLDFHSDAFDSQIENFKYAQFENGS